MSFFLSFFSFQSLCVKITAQEMAKKTNKILPAPSSTTPSPSSSSSSSSSSSTSSPFISSSTPTNKSNKTNLNPISSSIPTLNSNTKSIDNIEESSDNKVLQSYLHGNILDPSILLSCPLLCRSLPFKTENKFMSKKSIFKDSHDSNNDTKINNNKSKETNKYDNINNINNDNINNDNKNYNDNNNNNINDNNNNNSNNDDDDKDREGKEIDLSLELYLEKEHVTIIQIINNAIDCLKFSFGHLHHIKKNNLKKYEKSNRINHNSLLLNNSASMVINNNNQISKFNENNNKNNNNNSNNHRNFDNNIGNKYTGTLSQSLLISANLAVLCNCALLLGRLYRKSLLKVTILRNNIEFDIIYYLLIIYNLLCNISI